MNFYARDYVSPRQRKLTSEEKKTREISYGLKIGESEAVRIASGEMSALITKWKNIILIPVPDSKGNTFANLKLCDAISNRIGRVKTIVADMLKRREPVISQCLLRRRGKKISYSTAQHKMTADVVFCKMLAGMCDGGSYKVAYVDNVLTTGSTVNACMATTGISGDALIFSKTIKINRKFKLKKAVSNPERNIKIVKLMTSFLPVQRSM